MLAPAEPVRGPVVVTGTDTGVGKTMVTAAIAAAAGAAGLRVAVVKPAQTGMPGSGSGSGSGLGPGPGPGAGARAEPEPPGPEPPGPGPESDVEIVVRLAGPATGRTLITYSHPLAPAAAARVAGRASPDLATVTGAVGELGAHHDLVIVEGAGGLLVPMGPLPGSPASWTLADLAAALGAPAVVVARAGLGTLNHTALTLEALARRHLRAFVVVGVWPAEPELVHRTNLADLPGELAGVLPERAGMLAPAAFRAGASAWLAPVLHGHLDAPGFRAAGRT